MSLTAEQKFNTIREQVISKIHWGDDEDQVRTWLKMEKGIRGNDADILLKEAWKIRRREIRARALILAICSSVGLLLCGLLLFFLSGTNGLRVFAYSRVGFAIVAIGAASMVGFFTGLYRLISGRKFGSVD